jgi:Transglycosylase SLT domain/SPOR domain
MRACFVLMLSLISLGTPSALGQGSAQPDQAPVEGALPQPLPTSGDSICLMIESAARANDLPVDYFARVIWQESRFQPDVVGPRTRNGQRAQGIGQFMPETAAERRLLDPFDPVEALPKSAQFLAELRTRFGNLGLAAAAYNAGPQRLRDFLLGTRPLPTETRNYVVAITGVSVDDWAKAAKAAGDPHTQPAVANCHDLVALLKRAPNLFVEELQERIDSVATSPWGVELGAGFSRDRVLTIYANLFKRLGEILSGHDPSILSSVFRSRGTRPFYQVRIGAETRESANGLCAKIVRAGGACIVLHSARQSG